MTITLVVPVGADDFPISHGTVDYQPSVYRADHTDPNSKHLLDVPPNVAEPFIHKGGFYPMPEQAPPPSSEMTRLYQPAGPTSCTWKDKSYEPDADGCVEVPAEAGGTLAEAFGFRLAADRPFVEPTVAVEPEPARVRRGKA
jgi:hypothetical protein